MRSSLTSLLAAVFDRFPPVGGPGIAGSPPEAPLVNSLAIGLVLALAATLLLVSALPAVS